MKKRIIISLIIISFSLNAYANQRAAVMNLIANNCADSLALAVSDMLSGRIYDTGVFTLIERGQMQSILKEQEFQMSGCTDQSCAVKIGQLLSAEKIVIGSVNKTDTFKIEIKIVDIATARIDANFSASSADEAGFEAATIELARQVADHYGKEAWFGEKNYRVYLSGLYLMPMGDYADIAKAGMGANLGFSAEHIAFRNSIVGLSAGFFLLGANKDTAEPIQAMQLTVYAGYALPVMDSLKIIPQIGLGLAIQKTGIDENGKDENCDYEYTAKSYNDPLASLAIEIDYRVHRKVNVFIATSYTAFFEKSTTLTAAGVSLGVKYNI